MEKAFPRTDKAVADVLCMHLRDIDNHMNSWQIRHCIGLFRFIDFFKCYTSMRNVFDRIAQLTLRVDFHLECGVTNCRLQNSATEITSRLTHPVQICFRFTFA